MNKAIQTAYYLLELASKEAEPMFLTHLQIQKLLYYVQGWSLALRGNPIFEDPLEAWVHGPAVNTVYDEFKIWGDKPITPSEKYTIDALDNDEMSFVDSIWENYKKYSAIELRSMTHHETPWLKSREGLQCDERSRNEIQQVCLINFFQDEFRKHEIKGLELEKVKKMLPPSKVRRGRPFVDLLAQVGL